MIRFFPETDVIYEWYSKDEGNTRTWYRFLLSSICATLGLVFLYVALTQPEMSYRVLGMGFRSIVGFLLTCFFFFDRLEW
jgi:hypothetical protein